MSSIERITGEFMSVGGHRLHFRALGSVGEAESLVFLHEGLGSVDLWRRFPDEVVAGAQRSGFVYSRYGNGWSTPLSEPRQPDYMHREALQVLPEVLERLSSRPVLIGHSDGASIALIHAGSGHDVSALVLIAPHVFVEPMTLRSIAEIRDRFESSGMAERMAKYHLEPATTFLGWANVWLSSGFRVWNIEEYIPTVSCPTLLVQGEDDEYGTELQLDAIAARLGSPPRRLIVTGAGHSPHLSHHQLVSDAVVEFVKSVVP